MFISFELIIPLRIYLKKTVKGVHKDLDPRLFLVALFVVMKDWENVTNEQLQDCFNLSSPPHPDCSPLDFLMLISVLLNVWCSELDSKRALSSQRTAGPGVPLIWIWNFYE